jgi:periplasmic protein CpxP/Spy
MRKIRGMISRIGLLGCLLIAGSVVAVAQQAAAPPAPLPHDRPELGLSQQQKDQIKQIREEHRERLRALRSDTSLTPAQRRARARELRKETRAKVDAVLTPEQRTKLRQFRQERRAHRLGRSPAGGPGGAAGGPGNF